MVAILHGLWDGLPGVAAAILSPGLDVFIGQALLGGIGLFLLWRRWSEAQRLQMKKTILLRYYNNRFFNGRPLSF